MPHVVRDRLVGHHFRHGLLDRQARADHVLVVVHQLDRDVLVHVCPAQQREALFPLVIGQRERGVLVKLDVFALEHERLTRGALALLAAVHEHDSLLRRGTQDRLVLTDLDLDAYRLEPHDMLVGHGSLADCTAFGTAGQKRLDPHRAGGPPPPPALLANRATAQSCGAGRPAGPWRM